jgi:hypothetical protein
VEVWAVNRGTHGMRAAVRWAFSPHRRAILVVEDPVSIEADPLPNGFLYASEATGAVVQLDDVWDVAPSPDWTRLAFGRAFVMHAGERDTVPEREWRRLLAWLPEDVTARSSAQMRRELEAHAFPTSSMTLIVGVGLTQVMRVDVLPAGRVAAPIAPTLSLHGWRVRWMPSGDTLAVGAAPRVTDDDAPPARWVLVRPGRGASYRDSVGATTDSSRFARIPWIRGPTMEATGEVSYPPPPPQSLAVGGGAIEVRGGQIVLVTRAPGRRVGTRTIGPGVPLAATAGGRFVVALVNRADSRTHEMRTQLVVYHVPPR